jgi:hypothetical protein
MTAGLPGFFLRLEFSTQIGAFYDIRAPLPSCGPHSHGPSAVEGPVHSSETWPKWKLVAVIPLTGPYRADVTKMEAVMVEIERLLDEKDRSAGR